MENKENDKELEDIFYRKEYKFMIQHGLNGKVMQVLKDAFNVEEILLIEKKKEEPK